MLYDAPNVYCVLGLGSFEHQDHIIQMHVQVSWRASMPMRCRWACVSMITIKYSQLVGIQPISNEIPKSYSLSQNYPNPFNPSTKIRFEVPLTNLSRTSGSGMREGDLGGFVKIIVYDALGKEVITLVNENLKPGSYEAEWNAFNEPSGIYFYKIEAGSFNETKKMILIK